MAIQDLDSIMVYPTPPDQPSGAPTISSTQVSLSSATDAVIVIFTVPKTGSIDKIWFRTGGVTTGCTLDVRLETVNLTTGLNSGTLWGTNTNASQVIANTDDNLGFEVTLTATASVTKGDLIALVFDVGSGTPNLLGIAGFQDSGSFSIPAIIVDDGTPSTVGYAPIVGISYTTTGYAYVDGFYPMLTITTSTFNNTSTPDIYANRFQLPFRARVTGFWVCADFDGDANINLYDSDGTTVLLTAVIDKDVPNGLTAGAVFRWYFDDTAVLEPGVNYWIGIEPNSATNLSIYSYETPGSSFNAAMAFGDNFQKSTAKTPTGTGDWTTTATSQLFIGLLIDGVDYSTGGGQKGHVF